MASGRAGNGSCGATMKRKHYLIPSLLAAGFGSHDPATASLPHVTTTGSDDPNAGGQIRAFTQDHYVTLASHSSHSSHASHSSGYGGGGHYSHTSHRSSSGGSYDDDEASDFSPAPLYSPNPPPPAPAPLPSPALPAQPLFAPTDRATAPPPDGLPALSGRTKRFAAIVRRVQLALLAQDFYKGPINGSVGSAVRSALRKFQKDRGLDVTGTITPQTLDALMISSQ